MLILLQTLSLILLIFITKAFSVDLCFYTNPTCMQKFDANNASNSFGCCTNAKANGCCFSEHTDHCFSMSATHLNEGDTVSYYGLNQQASCYANNTLGQIDSGMNNGNFCIPLSKGPAPPKNQCALMWTMRGHAIDEKREEKNGTCGSPDLFHYTTDSGLSRDIFVPKGQGKIVHELLRNKDWRALERYPTHNRTRS